MFGSFELLLQNLFTIMASDGMVVACADDLLLSDAMDFYLYSSYQNRILHRSVVMLVQTAIIRLMVTGIALMLFQTARLEIDLLYATNYILTETTLAMVYYIAVAAFKKIRQRKAAYYILALIYIVSDFITVSVIGLKWYLSVIFALLVIIGIAVIGLIKKVDCE